MKVRGSLIVTKVLQLLAPGGSAPADGLLATSDNQGRVLWKNLKIPIVQNTNYDEAGSLVRYDGDIYYSLEDNAAGTNIEDPDVWKPLGMQGSALTVDQLAAIQSAANPSAENPFITRDESRSFSIAGSKTVEEILSVTITPLSNVLWIATDEGVDSFASPVHVGDGLYSTSDGWLNIGPIRGPVGPAGPIIVPVDKLLIFKIAPNADNQNLEVGDYCYGIVQNQFIQANYLGPNPLLLTSFKDVT
jgi:hypothetical protein